MGDGKDVEEASRLIFIRDAVHNLNLWRKLCEYLPRDLGFLSKFVLYQCFWLTVRLQTIREKKRNILKSSQNLVREFLEKKTEIASIATNGTLDSKKKKISCKNKDKCRSHRYLLKMLIKALVGSPAPPVNSVGR